MGAASYKKHSSLESRQRHQQRAQHMQQRSAKGQAVAFFHQEVHYSAEKVEKVMRPPRKQVTSSRRQTRSN